MSEDSMTFFSRASSNVVTYFYDTANRLRDVTNGAYNVRYSYFSNSRLVSSAAFRNNTNTRMTTSRAYDRVDRLLKISSTGSGMVLPESYAYDYNSASQRVKTTLADGSYWVYKYDSMGQLTSGKKYWADGTAVPGQQFEYGYDDIGNRTSAKEGGDDNGNSLRSSSYTATALNQYSSRTNAPGIDILGIANALATVTVSNHSTYRKGEYFQKALVINNASGAQYPSVTNIAILSGVTNIEWGKVYVPPAAESYTHDKDGNLTQDARWNYTWDAENRLINQEARNGSDPSTSIAHGYDYRSRRISIKVTETGGGLSTNRFIYNGWNVIAEFNGGGVLQKSFVWGKDLSGSEQGAGGVGGLVMLVIHTNGTTGTYFPAYDGNGNLITLWKGSESSSGIKARYEYDPFHNVLRATGDIAKENNHLAATKYYCWRSGKYYYGFRHYDPDTGRWLSNDPIGEEGGCGLYSFVFNNTISYWDYIGAQPQTNLDLLKEELGEDAYDATLCRKFTATASGILNETPIGQAKIAITRKDLRDRSVGTGGQVAAAVGFGLPALKKGVQCCKAGYVCIKLKIVKIFSQTERFRAATGATQLIAGSGDSVLLGIVDKNGVVHLFEAGAGAIEGHTDLVKSGLVDPSNIQRAFSVLVKKGDVNKLCTTSALNPASGGYNISDETAKKVLEAIEAKGAAIYGN